MILICAVIALSADVRAANRYVSPSGADTNDGLGPEPARALRTVQSGVDRLEPGDTLHIRAGVYRETISFPRSGRARHARQNVPTRQPILDATGINRRPALRFDEKGATCLDLPDISDRKITATVFAVFSNPVAGSEVNHDPRILTASDGKGHDYQVGLCASVPGMRTGGPRQSVFVQRDRWARKVRIGCFSPLDQTFFTGHIAEILVYERELPRTEQDRLRAYLMLKWDLR